VRRLYRSGSVIAVVRIVERYRLDLVGVQVIRWDKWGTVKVEDFN
jgi:hypothetical protein